MSALWSALRDAATSPTAVVLACLAAAGILGTALTRVLRAVLTRLARRTQTELDDELATKLGGPVSTIIAIQLFRIALAWIDVSARQTAALLEWIGVATIACVMWGAFRAIDLLRLTLERRPWAIERPASRSLLALGGRFAKVAVLAMGLVIALSQLGVSVASLIAGLGIGGLVFALAAQKTVENVFGAVSIGVDQPMREGDFVKIYDFVGTVEQIGLRSTRIRTLDRTVITIPNGELASQRIESYTARDRIRFACTVGLEYATTPAQMRSVLASLEQILRDHPKIWPDAVVVRFQGFGDSTLDIEVMAWFTTADWGEFQAIRQDILLAFMDTIAAAGTSIAFPTRTIHIAASPTEAHVQGSDTAAGHGPVVGRTAHSGPSATVTADDPARRTSSRA